MTIVLILFVVVLFIISLLLWLDRSKLLFLKQNLERDLQNLKLQNEKLEFIYKAEKENSTNNLLIMQKTLEEKFENISNRVLKSQQDDLNKKHSENLAVILNPFKNDINNFKLLIEKTNETNREDKGFLKKHLDDLKNMNSALSKNADDLVNALKGNSKIQGDWGENHLKNILDMAGFIEGIDYDMQFNLKNEDGANLRPDCVISLPDGKKLIVDSKVSISNYIDYIKCEDDITKKRCLELHVSSIKKHISELSTKEYQKFLKDNSLDFVFMFIPNEHAYIEALKFDNNIYDNAYKNNVAITTPSSILPILRTVKNLWNIEKQNENASKIAERAGQLYDKLVGFVSNMENIDKGLIGARKAYDDAFKQLSSGRGNAISLAESMKDLGAKTNKDIAVHSKQLLDFDDNN